MILVGSCYAALFRNEKGPTKMMGSVVGGIQIVPFPKTQIAQKPYIIWSLGPKDLKYESLEP